MTFAQQLANNPFRQQLESVATEMIGVHHDSEMLIDEVIDHRQFDTTPASFIHSQCDKRDKANQPSQHELDKAERARRVEQYTAQYAANDTINYDVDERRLNQAELAFAGVMVKAGIIELDD